MIGDNDPNRPLDKGDSYDVKQDSDEDRVFDIVDYSENCLVLIFPFKVEESGQASHQIGGGSDVRLIIEFVHKLRLGSQFWIGNRVSPMIDEDHDKGSQDRGKKQYAG